MSLHDIVKASGGILYANGRRALIPAPGHSPHDRSVSLMLTDTGRIIVHSFGSATINEIRDYLRGLGCYGNEKQPERNDPRLLRRPLFSTSAEKQHRAQGLWNQCRPVKGTLSEIHLAEARAIQRPADRLENLRHSDAFPLSAYDVKCSALRPALVARIQNTSGSTTGLEITYLNQSGQRDFSLYASRKIIGTVPAGAFVSFDPPHNHMVVGEGVMTVLSATEKLNLPGRALLSASNLCRFEPEQTIQHLTIATDRGRAGETAANTLRQRLIGQLTSINIVLPPETYEDFNAWSQALRKEKGRAEEGDV